MDRVLYDRVGGYYSRGSASADYSTSGRISPVFTFALARLVSEFVGRIGDGLYGIVDAGCGDGSLISSLASSLPPEVAERGRFWGVDRAVNPAQFPNRVTFQRGFAGIPKDVPLLILSNELFDALPFARVVQRPDGLRELCVISRDDQLDWDERPARPDYVEYFRRRGIEPEQGQFADVSLEWARLYRDLCRLGDRALIVTFDYGFPQRQLFDPRFRRFGTAAAYSRHQVSRDLLARPSEQDLTAHINFDDLSGTGELNGYSTLKFTRQAEFLLTLGITDHPLFAPASEVNVGDLSHAVEMIERREAARRLVLPDGIGEDIRVLVQGRGVPTSGWNFQRGLPLGKTESA